METARTLLVVDDDADVLKAAWMALSRRGVAVEIIQSPDGIEERVRGASYDAVLLDMNFALGERSGREGLDVLARLQAADPNLSVVLMTTYGAVSLAVDALKRGAADFVLKPWRNDRLAQTMAEAVALTEQRRGAGAEMSLDELERRAIERALRLHDGNVSRAAATLGLTRPALYRRMARHGL
ncbi:MAG: response regulator transcription factor [Caulobacterales bacterium]